MAARRMHAAPARQNECCNSNLSFQFGANLAAAGCSAADTQAVHRHVRRVWKSRKGRSAARPHSSTPVGRCTSGR